jgi:hypothetical protein
MRCRCGTLRRGETLSSPLVSTPLTCSVPEMPRAPDGRRYRPVLGEARKCARLSDSRLRLEVGCDRIDEHRLGQVGQRNQGAPTRLHHQAQEDREISDKVPVP